MSENLLDNDRISRFLMILAMFFCVIAGSITAEIGFDGRVITEVLRPLMPLDGSAGSLLKVLMLPEADGTNPAETVFWWVNARMFGLDYLPSKFLMLLGHLAAGMFLFRFLVNLPVPRVSASLASGVFVLLPFTLQNVVLTGGAGILIMNLAALGCLAAYARSTRITRYALLFRITALAAYCLYLVSRGIPGIVFMLMLLVEWFRLRKNSGLPIHKSGIVIGILHNLWPFILLETLSLTLHLNIEFITFTPPVPLGLPLMLQGACACALVTAILFFPGHRWNRLRLSLLVMAVTSLPLLLMPEMPGTVYMAGIGVAFLAGLILEQVIRMAGPRNFIIPLMGCIMLFGIISAMDYSYLESVYAGKIRAARAMRQLDVLLRNTGPDDQIVIILDEVPDEGPDSPGTPAKNPTGISLLKDDGIRRMLFTEPDTQRVHVVSNPEEITPVPGSAGLTFRYKRGRMIPVQKDEKRTVLPVQESIPDSEVNPAGKKASPALPSVNSDGVPGQYGVEWPQPVSLPRLEIRFEIYSETGIAERAENLPRSLEPEPEEPLTPPEINSEPYTVVSLVFTLDSRGRFQVKLDRKSQPGFNPLSPPGFSYQIHFAHR